MIYVPEFIPDEYQFKQFVIEKGSELVRYEYTYEGKREMPLYICFTFNSMQKDIMLSGYHYHSPRTGEKMYINEIKGTNEYTVTRVTDKYECMINGIGSKNIGIRIMENLREF